MIGTLDPVGFVLFQTIPMAMPPAESASAPARIVGQDARRVFGHAPFRLLVAGRAIAAIGWFTGSCASA
jgi:hypothetical protein